MWQLLTLIMKWGVGKGRFRNLSAMILSVILALMFLVVWTFFNRIKPLTIDTSSRSQTATIADRLVTTSGYEQKGEITQSDVNLFRVITDSVYTIFTHRFPSSGNALTQLQNDSLLVKLHQVQVQTRSMVAFLLNQSALSIGAYRQCELKVLHVLANDSTPDNAYRHALFRNSKVREAASRVRSMVNQVSLSERERTMIRELRYEMQNKLLPFVIGLSSDTFTYKEQRRVRSTAGVHE